MLVIAALLSAATCGLWESSADGGEAPPAQFGAPPPDSGPEPPPRLCSPQGCPVEGRYQVTIVGDGSCGPGAHSLIVSAVPDGGLSVTADLSSRCGGGTFHAESDGGCGLRVNGSAACSFGGEPNGFEYRADLPSCGGPAVVYYVRYWCSRSWGSQPDGFDASVARGP